MSDFVPASTAIKYQRVGNMDTDRLQRRLAYLNEHKTEIARNADARIEIRMRAREILSIKAELDRRKETWDAQK